MVGDVNIEKARVFLTTTYLSHQEVTLDIEGAKDWQVTVKGDLLSPIYKETTFPLQFTGFPAEALTQVYSEFFQNGEGTLEVWTSWEENTPITLHTFDLDFDTYEKDDNTVSIACRKVDLRTLIKKNGKTEYSIPVKGIAQDKMLRYERGKVQNKLVFRRADFETRLDTTISNFITPVQGKTEIDERKVVFALVDSDTPTKDAVEVYEDENGYLFKTLQQINVSTWYTSFGDLAGTHIKFGTAADMSAFIDSLTAGGMYVGYRLYKTVGATKTLLNERYDTCEVLYDPDYVDLVVHVICLQSGYKVSPYFGWAGTLEKDAKVSFEASIFSDAAVVAPTLAGVAAQSFSLCGVGELSVYFEGESPTPRVFDCAMVEDVLRELLVRMGDVNPNILVRSKFVSYVALIPMNALKGAYEPSMLISYDMLRTFLRSCACDVILNGDIIEVVDIMSNYGIFNAGGDTIIFSEEECADLRISSYSEGVFNEIKIGNSGASNTDGDAMRYEKNIAVTFTNNANTTNTLDLTSPIRTDSIGFELSIPDTLESTSKEEKDIFAVKVVYSPENGSGVYIIDNQNTIVSDEGLYIREFNTDFEPRRLLYRWLEVIAASADVFIPATTAQDRIRNVAIYDIGAAPVYLPMVYDIATSDDKSLLGTNFTNENVSFTYGTGVYSGFILELSENPLIRRQKEMKLLASGGTPIKYRYGNITYPSKMTVNSVGNVYYMSKALLLECNVFGVDLGSNAIFFASSDPEFTVTQNDIESNKVSINIRATANTTGVTRTSTITASVNGVGMKVCTVSQKPLGLGAVVNPSSDIRLSIEGFSDDTTNVYFENLVPSVLYPKSSWKRLMFEGVFNIGGTDVTMLPTYCLSSRIVHENNNNVEIYVFAKPIDTPINTVYYSSVSTGTGMVNVPINITFV